MHFSLTTIAAAAAFFAAVEAAPHGRHGRPHGTGVGSAGSPFPTGGFGGQGSRGGRNGTEGAGRGRGRGGQSGSGSFPTGSFPSGELPQPSGGFSAAAFGSDDSSFPTNLPQPSGGFGQQPSGSFGGQQPSGGFGGFPSGGFGQQPSGGFGGQSGFGGQQPTGGFGGFPSNFPQPSGGEIPSGIFPSDGSGFPTGFPGGDSPSGFPGAPSGGVSGPAPTAPPTLPTGGADLSSVSFDFPSSIQGNINAVEDDEDSKTTATSAAEPTETGSSDDSDDEGSSSATSEAASSPTGGSDDTSTSTTVATPTGGSSSGGNSTSGGSASATTTFPEAAGESTLSEPMKVTGEFDGGLVRFGRGVSCTGQSEGGDSDAVFQIEEGGTLKNVIIGADQSEGVHCMGSCTLENVWWEAVCEDALTIKQESGTSTVTGGGAKGADDKVIQHNGGGTVQVSGFYVEDFGKLYRSCGNCDTMYERHVVLDGIVADGGSSTLVGINSNYGDTATITNSCITNTKVICEEFEGNDTGAEPTSISTGPSTACKYTDADVSAC